MSYNNGKQLVRSGMCSCKTGKWRSSSVLSVIKHPQTSIHIDDGMETQQVSVYHQAMARRLLQEREPLPNAASGCLIQIKPKQTPKMFVSNSASISAWLNEQTMSQNIWSSMQVGIYDNRQWSFLLQIQVGIYDNWKWSFLSRMQVGIYDKGKDPSVQVNIYDNQQGSFFFRMQAGIYDNRKDPSFQGASRHIYNWKWSFLSWMQVGIYDNRKEDPFFPGCKWVYMTTHNSLTES